MSLSLRALCYLRAYEQGLEITDGFAFRAELEALPLNYSLQSLSAIDRWVSEVRRRELALSQRLRYDWSLQNTLYLLAFYSGEIVARALRLAPSWQDFRDQVMKADDPYRAIRGFRASAVCCFDDPRLKQDMYSALNPLVDGLFADDGGTGVHQTVTDFLVANGAEPLDPQAPLASLPAGSWPLGWSGQRPPVHSQQLADLRPITPVWVSLNNDPLSYLFEHVDALLCEGRVVWGRLVQANNDLFQPKFCFGAPAEVIYDPQGRAEPQELEQVARQLFQYKASGESYAEDEELRSYVQHLRDEYTRKFDLTLPASVLPYPLKLSGTYFDQRQLPNGMLSLGYFPLLIHDQHPGAVLPLPYTLWPAEFAAAWREQGIAATGVDFNPREAHRRQLQEFERSRENHARVPARTTAKAESSTGFLARLFGRHRN